MELRIFSKTRSKSGFWLFLAGLGSITELHLLGSIAITELVFCLLAPFFLCKDFHVLRHDGFMPFVLLSILCCVGCVISSKVNGVYWIFMVKGIAVPFVYFSTAVMLHRLLKSDLAAMKWFVLGAFFSSIISIFIFQPAVLVANNGALAEGSAATEMVTSHVLFWSSKLNRLLRLPTSFDYFFTPWTYSIFAPIGCAVVSAITAQGSGRSAAALAVVSSALIFIGGKKRARMHWLGKHMILLLMLGGVLAVALKTIYSHLAQSGALGENAVKKYELQTATGTGIINILMSGRMEFFCGLQACVDYPILGLGPRPIDRNGYVENYLRKYASVEDYQNYWKSYALNMKLNGGVQFVPDHSHVVFFWLRYGIFGLILWLHVLGLMFMYLKKYAPAIPQWYGYMCLMLPSTFWSILFNPPGARLHEMFFIVCLLFCRAIANGKVRFPVKMELEVLKHDAR